MGEPALALNDHITVTEYLEGELLAEERHEYFNGCVFAMAGASDRHEVVAGNVFSDIHRRLEGGPCRVFKGDLKVRLSLLEKDLFYYPDIMVACDPTDNHRYFRERPTLLIEVLSEDRNKDLVEKYLAYQRIESLREYVVISQDPASPAAYIHRRETAWSQREVRSGEDLFMASIGFGMPLDRAYRGLLPANG